MKLAALAALMAAVALVPATVAQATPRPTFTATVTPLGVSLYAPPFVGCGYPPCSYAWRRVETNQHLGLGRSLVVQLPSGCHTIELRMTERTFRNPTTPTATTTRSVCIQEAT